ncbi:proline-rich protein 11-like [Diprion similis]|uniref:proline-rich protein 11-like n=1 Tax=Diprion similis TaxID=362088 RepID=UPI001EF85B7F|nr:proline-rich protein 11-like [Diprion similis]
MSYCGPRVSSLTVKPDSGSSGSSAKRSIVRQLSPSPSSLPSPPLPPPSPSPSLPPSPPPPPPPPPKATETTMVPDAQRQSNAAHKPDPDLPNLRRLRIQDVIQNRLSSAEIDELVDLVAWLDGIVQGVQVFFAFRDTLLHMSYDEALDVYLDEVVL